MAVARRGWGDGHCLSFLKKADKQKSHLLLSGKLIDQRGAVYRKQKFVNVECCNRKSMLGKQVELPAVSQIISVDP